MEAIDIFAPLCNDVFGSLPVSAVALPKSGGDRRYWRLTFAGGGTILGALCPDQREAKAFVGLARAFSQQSGFRVPEVPAVSPDYSAYLVEDLGDRSLFSALGDPNAPHLVEDTLRSLARMQTVQPEVWKPHVVEPEFGARQVMWDLNYFKYEFLKPSGVSFDEGLLEDDFETFSSRISKKDESFWGFMMRDCQSRNVMLAPSPVFIDFQAGRFGPMIYDAVSFLWQAKAGFDRDFRGRMMEAYLDELAKCRPDVDISSLCSSVSSFALFRTLQVLGAYGFRGLVQHKAHFVESIPGALSNLQELIAGGVLDDYPELRRICAALVASRFASRRNAVGLHVDVFSFSYKSGYPEDLSGNGGGFMFDCRGMHNPGRYPEYRQLTGLDAPVKNFLRLQGEAGRFVNTAFDLVSASVKKYLDRGFSGLQVGFGCTGGQHRSVYCAEAMARLIKEAFPGVCVTVHHREQGIKREM